MEVAIFQKIFNLFPEVAVFMESAKNNKIL
jgi:hypothetical protein